MEFLLEDLKKNFQVEIAQKINSNIGKIYASDVVDLTNCCPP